MLGQEPAVLVRCCTASWPRGSSAAAEREQRQGKAGGTHKDWGIPLVFLPNLHRRCWEGEEAFAFLERGGDHTTEGTFPFHTAAETRYWCKMDTGV